MLPSFLRRTLGSLDWEEVSGALVGRARTSMGAAAAAVLMPLGSHAEVVAAYALVAEVTAARFRGETPPVNAVSDVRAELGRAERGIVLEPWSLISVGGALAGLAELNAWLSTRETPLLHRFAERITANAYTVRRLRESFDRDGQLADAAFPELARLRHQLDATRIRVQATFDALLADEGMSDLLMDRYVTERDGRLVLPVKMAHRKGMGILHGLSASGETAYVEPGQTVEMQNDLRELREAVQIETMRILAELSGLVAEIAPGASAAIVATGELDLACARAELGLDWNGAIPEVGQSGVIAARKARHPVLALRALVEPSRGEVVANDVTLGDAYRCLVLTGPNAGGKTVALKTVGLCALLVRMAIPLPVAERSRVDFFDPIFSDIGDQQSITQDKSTFSGHLGVLKEALASASAGTLVLVDEVAVGTDPAQGAALASAVVEALVAANARVVVTTHYPELKSSDDARIVVGGMEFSDGKPTYKLRIGRPSGSQALVIAKAVGLPEAVLERANTLLDAGQARLARLAATLDDEREAVRQESVQLAAENLRLQAAETELREREARLQTAMDGARDRLIAKTQERLAELEEEVAELVRELHRNPSLKEGNLALATIRTARAGLVEQKAGPIYEPKRGERVWVATIGQHGIVAALRGDSAEIQVKGMKLLVPFAKIGQSRDDPRLAVVSAPAARPPPQSGPASGGLRMPSNTLDLRGLRLDDATSEVERFLAVLVGRGESHGYLLHGHGTGALKSGLRERVPAMPAVCGCRPGETVEGGDAFTVVTLT